MPYYTLCTTVQEKWIGNVEDNKAHNTQAANIHQHLSQENITHMVERQGNQSGPVEKNKPGSHGTTNQKEKVELDWPHPQKTGNKHHPTSPEMEPTREKEARSPQKQLEKKC